MPVRNSARQLSCPRCGTPFLCTPEDIVHCQCNTVILSDETRQFLKKTTYDCLCKTCLSHFNSLIETTINSSFPVGGSALEEGVHYTVEHGNWVFTERYHLLRGTCCKNGCRNCPYGFRTDNRC